MKKRGLKNAAFIAKLLKKGNNIPEMIITSPAIRAYDTAKIFSEKFNLNYEDIIREDRLYMADYDDFVQVIKEIPELVKSAMILGHNPGLTFLGCAITNEDIENIPTSGVVRIDLDINLWLEISSMKGTLTFFEYPKKYSIANEEHD